MKVKIKKYFGNWAFYKNVFFIAAPVMGHMFVTTLVSLLDSFMIAQLGDIKTSGVNISNQIFFIVQVCVSSLATAGGIFMSQFSGAKQKNGMQHAFRFKVITLSAITIISMIIISVFAVPFLHCMVHGNINAKEIVPYGKQYLSIIVLSFFPFGISTAISSSLRENGNPQGPFKVAIIAAFINALGNYILIYGKFGAPRLEVSGAAYSTLVARLVELILLIFIAHKKDFFVSPLHIFEIDLKISKQIIKGSFWLLFADMIWGFSEAIVNAMYNGLGGSEVVSGMSAGWSIANLFLLSEVGLGTSITVIIGGLLGQNKLKEAKEKSRWFLALSFLVGIFLGLVEIVSSLALVPLFFAQLSIAAQKVAFRLLVMAAVYLPVWTLLTAQYYTLLAGGDSRTMSNIDTGFNIFVALPAAILLVHFTKVGPVMLYAIIQLVSIAKSVTAHFALKKETWVKNLT